MPGIAYDEIARIVKADATPPPVGSFPADAAVIAALPPLSMPKPGEINTGAISTLSLIPVVGSWLAWAKGNALIHAQQEETKKEKDAFDTGVALRQKTGLLAKFAFYRGWRRVEVVPYTTIDKPDEGLTVTLDDFKKTYRSVKTAPSVETYTVQSGAQAIAVPTVEKPTRVETLSQIRSEGLSARGYRTTGSIHVSRGTFFCAPGEHRIAETEYVSDLSDPQYNPNDDASNAQPLVTACGLGSSVSHREPGHFVLYRVVTVDEGTPAAFNVALERGNIREIGEPDAALFAPPPDYKEATVP
ncbi:MAG: hypothetical protein GIW99_09670 [Candidatus Eremiobacteraeota bacterium]|nr:hypothetical protein [Candidatus Eremiobacteraeota bacterium]MBC5827929.1 hypothetical protein [Candidatus Eremiobacteraeota bacterium]